MTPIPTVTTAVGLSFAHSFYTEFYTTTMALAGDLRYSKCTALCNVNYCKAGTN